MHRLLTDELKTLPKGLVPSRHYSARPNAFVFQAAVLLAISRAATDIAVRIIIPPVESVSFVI